MPHYAETLSKSHDYSPWPISSGELASLIDLGVPDDRIARYFGVKRVKVSALRAYYGLVGVRNLTPEDGVVPIQRWHRMDNADARPWRAVRKETTLTN